VKWLRNKKKPLDLSGTAAIAAGIIPTPDAEEYLVSMRAMREMQEVESKPHMLPASSISAAAPPSLSGVDRSSSCPMRRLSRAA
jgi:hypothetical protein